MASVWIQMREDKTPRKIVGGLSAHHAGVALQAGCNDWARTKSGRTAKPAPQNGLERILYFSDGNPAGSLFIEPCSPPSGPEAGSFKVGEVKQ